MKLKDIIVRNIRPGSKPLKLSDGGGLHLLVQPNGSKLWRLAYRLGGKQMTLALGVYPSVSLADARTRRVDAKKLCVVMGTESIRARCRAPVTLTEHRVPQPMLVRAWSAPDISPSTMRVIIRSTWTASSTW